MFRRQMRRLAEAGKVEWCVVDEEPFESLADRFSAAAAGGEWDVAFASHVLFSSGHVFDECFELLAARGIASRLLARRPRGGSSFWCVAAILHLRTFRRALALPSRRGQRGQRRAGRGTCRRSLYSVPLL